MASRAAATGALRWRRNVCSSVEGGHAVATHPSTSTVATMDTTGMVRLWNIDTGDLQWQTTTTTTTGSTIAMDAEGVVWINGQTALSKGQIVSDANKNPVSTQEFRATEISCDSVGTVSLGTNDDDDSSVLVLDKDTVLSADRPLFLSTSSSSSSSTTSSDDSLNGLILLSCIDSAMAFLVTTERATTTFLTLRKNKDLTRLSTQWSAEEGLGSISTGLLLDASRVLEGAQDGAQTRDLLTFSSRLAMHWKAFTNMWIPTSTTNNNNDDDDESTYFGFHKMAVLVSDTAHRLYGMPTAGPTRSQIQYAYELPTNAAWHRVVHGEPNAFHGDQGIQGKAHSRELLVLSFISNQVEWVCIEGASGQVHGRGSVAVDAPVAQIVPIASDGSACRQGAMIVTTQDSVVVVPDNEGTQALAAAQVAAPHTNGFFAHRLVDKKEDSAVLEAIRLDAADGTNQSPTISAEVSGMAQFPGETIVSVAYPPRDEIVQSPCKVLGDQSLLLKYLNPHMVAVMTMTSSSTEEEKDPFANILKSPADAKGSAKQKRKPAGVSGSSAESAAPTVVEGEPNLFVNLIDSVSGRVLYRASHSNAILTPAPSMVISENWVFYSFMNERTRRAQIGVLSLYEGMVDSQGLTAFNTPEHLKEFSSLDARESKPVVLAKAYSLPKPVTALGITATRAGISGKRLLMACTDGQVYHADRQMLEPRRPMGQVKDAEKEEGLRQYSEMIPMISYMSLSYTQVVEGVKYITSAPTDLESQTFIMAYGGPDIFFTRTSPSRGFDLLPEEFNRIMLSIVVVVLIVGAFALQRMVFNKKVKKGWV